MLLFPMLIQAEVQWLEIIEMKQMSWDAANKLLPAAEIVCLLFQDPC